MWRKRKRAAEVRERAIQIALVLTHIAAIGQGYDIVGRELQRLLTIRVRRRELALLGLRAATSCPRLVQAPLQLDGLSEICQRIRGGACLRIHDAAIEISPGIARVDLDDAGEVPARGAEIALLKVNDSAIKQGLDVTRGELQCLVVIAQGASSIPLAIAGEAAVVPCGGQAPISGDGEVEVGYGAFKLALFQPGAAALQIGFGCIAARYLRRHARRSEQ